MRCLPHSGASILILDSNLKTDYHRVMESKKFTEPIPLPNGKPLATLCDAALYITKLPKAEHYADEWQAALYMRCQKPGPGTNR